MRLSLNRQNLAKRSTSLNLTIHLELASYCHLCGLLGQKRSGSWCTGQREAVRTPKSGANSMTLSILWLLRLMPGDMASEGPLPTSEPTAQPRLDAVDGSFPNNPPNWPNNASSSCATHCEAPVLPETRVTSLCLALLPDWGQFSESGTGTATILYRGTERTLPCCQV